MGNEKGWNGFEYEYPTCNAPCGEEYEDWCPSCKEHEEICHQKLQEFLTSKK